MSNKLNRSKSRKTKREPVMRKKRRYQAVALILVMVTALTTAVSAVFIAADFSPSDPHNHELDEEIYYATPSDATPSEIGNLVASPGEATISFLPVEDEHDHNHEEDLHE